MADFRGLGGVLSTTFRVLGDHAGTFLGITALVHVPLVLYMGYLVARVETGYPSAAELGVLTAGAALLGFLMQMIATSAVVYGVFQALRGREVRLADVWQRGLARALPVLGVAFVSGLAVALGFLAFVVPGFILLAMLYAAVPAAVVEDLSVSEALTRSAELTRGYRWPIFGVVIVLGLITGIPDRLLERALGGSGDQLAVYFLLSTLLSIVGAALHAVAASVAYHELRRAREGLDLDDLAAVFD